MVWMYVFIHKHALYIYMHITYMHKHVQYIHAFFHAVFHPSIYMYANIY